MTPLPALLTTAEVAEELRTTAKSVRQWIDEGKLPAITLPGGTFRIRREDVEAILRGNSTTATTTTGIAASFLPAAPAPTPLPQRRSEADDEGTEWGRERPERVA
jgi:excisionase family DNA binding protein